MTDSPEHAECREAVLQAVKMALLRALTVRDGQNDTAMGGLSAHRWHGFMDAIDWNKVEADARQSLSMETWDPRRRVEHCIELMGPTGTWLYLRNSWVAVAVDHICKGRLPETAVWQHFAALAEQHDQVLMVLAKAKEKATPSEIRVTGRMVWRELWTMLLALRRRWRL